MNCVRERIWENNPHVVIILCDGISLEFAESLQRDNARCVTIVLHRGEIKQRDESSDVLLVKPPDFPGIAPMHRSTSAQLAMAYLFNSEFGGQMGDDSTMEKDHMMHFRTGLRGMCGAPYDAFKLMHDLTTHWRNAYKLDDIISHGRYVMHRGTPRAREIVRTAGENVLFNGSVICMVNSREFAEKVSREAISMPHLERINIAADGLISEKPVEYAIVFNFGKSSAIVNVIMASRLPVETIADAFSITIASTADEGDIHITHGTADARKFIAAWESASNTMRENIRTATETIIAVPESAVDTN